MALNPNKRKQKPPSGSRVAALIILTLIIGAVAGYYFISTSSKTVLPPKRAQISKEKAVFSSQSTLKAADTEPALPPVPRPQYKVERHPVPIEATPLNKAGTGVIGTVQLAIIVDDMGSSLTQAQRLAAIKVPLTFALIPALRLDQEVAAYAASQKIETMIHIPMQSKGWPKQRLEANGLLVSMDSAEIERRVSALLQRFPAAVGVNNHMGSAFTEQEDKMVIVLQMLKKNNLFFIDSVTSPASVGMNIARSVGAKSDRRDVFLDNEQERGYILGQLNQAVKIARKNGSAIAICHPHPATIAALAAALPGLAGQGVQLVPVSQLVN